MKIELSIIISLAAIFISLGGFIISLRSFQRNRRFDNENHIYKIKIEKYHEILTRIASVLDILDVYVEMQNDFQKSPTPKFESRILDTIDKIEEEMNNLEYYLVPNSLIVPSEMVDLLEKFLENIFALNVEEENVELMEKHLDKCFEMADEIQISMRNDLHIDSLNKTLFKRIRSRAN